MHFFFSKIQRLKQMTVYDLYFCFGCISTLIFFLNIVHHINASTTYFLPRSFKDVAFHNKYLNFRFKDGRHVQRHAFLTTTVDSRYLVVHWTFWNISRYPYIRHIRFADLRKNSKQIKQPHFTTDSVLWLLKLEIYWKYCGKEEKYFFSFPQYFVTCC